MLTKKLLLFLLMIPVGLMAQEIKNGTIIFDMHPKKDKAPDTTTNTVQEQKYPSDEEEEEEQNAKKHRIVRPKPEPSTSVKADWRKDGLFQALFHAGFNACQVDGDGYSGYNYFGAEFGLGALMKVHRLVSLTMEFNYTMKGAKQAFRPDSLSATYTLQKYQVQWDYLEVPIGININAVTPKNKQIMLLSLGLAPAVMTRYKQFDEDGDNVTNNPPEGQPHRFDLSAFGGFYFVIHKNYAIGGKFSYSITKVRGPNLTGISRLLGEYNNDLTVDFMYILNTTPKNKRR